MNHKLILLKLGSNKKELTIWEKILIARNKGPIINFDIPQADYLTKKLILNT